MYIKKSIVLFLMLLIIIVGCKRLDEEKTTSIETVSSEKFEVKTETASDESTTKYIVKAYFGNSSIGSWTTVKKGFEIKDNYCELYSNGKYVMIYGKNIYYVIEEQ